MVSVNRWSIDNHTKIVHRLASIGTVPRNRRRAHYLSDHPPFLGRPGDKTGKKKKRFLASQRKEYTPLHVNWKSPGRGFTKYKMHRQRLYRLCCFEVNVGEVFVHCKQNEGRQYCFNVDIKMKCFYNYCAQNCVFYVSIPFPSIYNQSIPIYWSIGIDNRYQSITTRIFAIDWSSIININRLIDIDWYWLISIAIDYRF